MVWWQGALWALAGGFVVEGLEFAAVQRRYGKWPWQVDAAATGDGGAAGPLGYFLAELIRLAAGGVLGAALAGQVTAPLPALAIGAAAPVIAGHLATYVPLPPAAPSLDPAQNTSASADRPALSDNLPSVEPVPRQHPPASHLEPLPKREGTS